MPYTSMRRASCARQVIFSRFGQIWRRQIAPFLLPGGGTKSLAHPHFRVGPLVLLFPRHSQPGASAAVLEMPELSERTESVIFKEALNVNGVPLDKAAIQAV